MDHIAEQILEKLYLAPEELSEQEKSTIELHLQECALCREQAEKLKAFYGNLQDNLRAEPTERDRAFAAKMLAKKRLALPQTAIERRASEALDAVVEIIEPYRRSLPQRVIRYVQIHPIQASAGFSLAAAVVVLGLLFVRPVKDTVTDTNPSYARAKDEFLVAYNAHGDELWRNHIGIGYDMKSLNAVPRFVTENYLATVDVDNDGRNEVIATFYWVDGAPWKNALVCFKADGSVLWEYEQKHKPTFAGEAFPNDFFVRSFVVGDFENNGKEDLIAIAGQHDYYPNVIVRLDPRTGKPLAEYWHSGSIGFVLHRDLDNDGIEEILLGGANNGLNKAALVVLDPRFISGHAPTTQSYVPDGVGPGTEKFYVVFPRSDLQILANQKRSDMDMLEFNPSGIETHIIELVEGQNLGPMFVFNNAMECTKVEDEDVFVRFHQNMEAEGKLTKKLNAKYYGDLRQGVQYWDGEKFVHEPTMNKRYLEARNERTPP